MARPLDYFFMRLRNAWLSLTTPGLRPQPGRWNPRRKPSPLGRLTFAPDISLPQTHALGPFNIFIGDKGEGTSLEITHQAEPDRPLWASPPGRGFIAAALGHETVVRSRGHFLIRDEIRSRLTRQHIEQIDLSDDSLTLLGTVQARQRERARRSGYRLRFNVAGRDRLRFELHFEDPELNRSYLRYRSEPDERFYGFGAQYSYLDMKGKRLPIFTGEQGVGRGRQPLTLAVELAAGVGGSWHTTYAGVPHYLSSKCRSLFLENAEYVVFDFRRDAVVRLELFSSSMCGQIIYGDSPRALIERYTDDIGRMPELPSWLHQGAIIGLQGGSEKVLERLAMLERHGVKISGVWLQDWVGQRATGFGERLWWNWQLDRSRYPDWEELAATLEAKGIRVLSYVNPYLADDAGERGYDRDLFDEAKREGYLVRDPDGKTYLTYQGDFYAALIDLTNPDARTWFKDVLTEKLLSKGVSGWMADFAEGMPYEGQVHSGEKGSSYHNHYPEDWAHLNREAIEEAGRLGDAIAFHRSGYTKSPGNALLFWLGDQNVSWDRHDGIKTVVTGLLSSGMSGFSLNHSDTGGYTTITDFPFNIHRTPELHKRWAELNAFTVVLRTHEGLRPDKNHQVYDDPDTAEHFAKMTRLYAGWAEYRRELVREAAETGLPVVRHPFLHYPDDPEAMDVKRQFMVGPELMVAPVLDPGVNEVSLYLPAGTWVHLWSEAIFGDENQGRWVSVSAPMGQPAVFYRPGSTVGEALSQTARAESPPQAPGRART